MQTASSRIWTQVAVSISYDSNHYTTNASIKYYRLLLYILVLFIAKETI